MIRCKHLHMTVMAGLFMQIVNTCFNVTYYLTNENSIFYQFGYYTDCAFIDQQNTGIISVFKFTHLSFLAFDCVFLNECLFKP